MEYKKGQVKILANTHTGRETFVDLQNIILNPGDDNEVTLGNHLDYLSKEIDSLKKQCDQFKNALRELTVAANKLNLK